MKITHRTGVTITLVNHGSNDTADDPIEVHWFVELPTSKVNFAGVARNRKLAIADAGAAIEADIAGL